MRKLRTFKCCTFRVIILYQNILFRSIVKNLIAIKQRKKTPETGRLLACKPVSQEKKKSVFIERLFSGKIKFYEPVFRVIPA